MARGHRINTSIVLAAVHGLSGLFGAVSEVEPSLFRPPPPPPPSLISLLASVDVKQHRRRIIMKPAGSVVNVYNGHSGYQTAEGGRSLLLCTEPCTATAKITPAVSTVSFVSLV